MLFRSPDGRTIELTELIDRCRQATLSLTPERLVALRREMLAQPPAFPETTLTVTNETTLAAIARWQEHADTLAAMNFASAKNPGGGFLNGSEAQEESLARSSALYASLNRAPDYYSEHRRLASALYSDRMILSPHCPVIRDDAGALLDEPQRVTFITSAAPNAGALRSDDDRRQIGRAHV